MKKVVTGLASLLLLAIIAQFFLAAMGAFNSKPTDEAFAPHMALGYAILVLAVVTVIAAAAARMPGRVTGYAGLTLLLVVVQILIAEVSKGIGDGSTVGQLIFGLHGINGLLVMGAAELVQRRSRQIAWKPAEQPAVPEMVS